MFLAVAELWVSRNFVSVVTDDAPRLGPFVGSAPKQIESEQHAVACKRQIKRQPEDNQTQENQEQDDTQN